VTNGWMSFVMFNYGNLNWTTGALSGGDTITGLGGNAAGVSIILCNLTVDSYILSFSTLPYLTLSYLIFVAGI